ncbi:MAG: VWD domain-containing protein [Verrucomicrobiae bacterium]|nr:VWD domain-containing protein [Verrucomicrobiae bacterium]
MKYQLSAIASCLLLALPLAAQAQINISPWQIHEGPSEFTLHPTTDEALRREAFDKATIPSQSDPGWKVVAGSEIAADGTLNISRDSAITKDKQELDFLFFQTVVSIPDGTTVEKFAVKIDQVDDGARVLLFHKDVAPQGYFDETRDIISQKSPREIDFSSKVTAPGDYRVVVVQYDQHRPSNNIKGVRILVDGKEVPPAPARANTPFFGSRGDVHITTPDGLVYDYQGTGEFILCRSDDGKSMLQARQELWDQKPGVSVNTAAAILVDGQRLEFYLKPKFRLFVNDVEQAVPTALGTQSFPGGVTLETTSVWGNSSDHTVFSADGSFGARVIVRNGSHLDLGAARLSGQQKYNGSVGNMDGDPRNDMTLRDGKKVDPPASEDDLNAFWDSWRVKEGESLFADVKRETKQPTDAFPHVLAEIDPAKIAEAEKAAKAAGLTNPLAIREAAYDVAQTGSKVFLESAKEMEAAVKALPADKQKFVAGDAATQAVLAAAPAGPSLKDQVVNEAAAGHSTWEGSWAPSAKASLVMKSDSEFTVQIGNDTYDLKGKMGHAGGDPKRPLAVNLDLPNGDHLRFEWKSTDEIVGQFWLKGTKGPGPYNPPLREVKMKASK